MSKSILFCLFITLLAARVAEAQQSAREASPYEWRVEYFTTEDGLPSNDASSIRQDDLGFRHYGRLANRARRSNLALCLRLLAFSDQPGTAGDGHPTVQPDSAHHSSLSDGRTNNCPACKTGHLIFITTVPPSRAGPQPPINDLAYV